MKRFKSKIVQNCANRMVLRMSDILADYGERIVKDAYFYSHTNYVGMTRNSFEHPFERGEKEDPTRWANITYNLHDSYGSAVYIYGKLKKNTIRYAGEEKAKDYLPEDDHIGVFGRKMVDDYLEGYRANPQNPLELVCIVAMFYAPELVEQGYSVIADMAGDMSDIQRQIKGSRLRLV